MTNIAALHQAKAAAAQAEYDEAQAAFDLMLEAFEANPAEVYAKLLGQLARDTNAALEAKLAWDDIVRSHRN